MRWMNISKTIITFCIYLNLILLVFYNFKYLYTGVFDNHIIFLSCLFTYFLFVGILITIEDAVHIITERLVLFNKVRETYEKICSNADRLLTDSHQEPGTGEE